MKQWALLLLATAALPSQATLSVYFNQNAANRYTDPYRHIRRNGDNLETQIIKAIEGARERVWVSVQEIRLPLVAEALSKAKRAGIDVRVIIENNYNFKIADLDWQHLDPGSHSDRRLLEYVMLVDMNSDGRLSAAEIAKRDAMTIIAKAPITVKDDTSDGSSGSGLMHHKFLVIDHDRVVVTSANFTTSDVHGDMGDVRTRGNNNALLVIDNARANEIFAEEFGFQWGDPAYGSSKPRFGVDKPFRGAQRVNLPGGESLRIQFSPTGRRLPYEDTSSGLIETAMQEARTSVDMALFVFSDQKLVDSLDKVRMNNRGLQIRGLVEPTFAFADYSEVLDMWGLEMLGKNCRHEDGNRPWAQRASQMGVPSLPQGDFLHHKFAVIDAKAVIFGSHNWSDAGVFTNEETLVVVESRDVARAFKGEFDRLFRSGEIGAPAWVKEKIATRKAECRTQSH